MLILVSIITAYSGKVQEVLYKIIHVEVFMEKVTKVVCDYPKCRYFKDGKGCEPCSLCWNNYIKTGWGPRHGTKEKIRTRL